MSLVVRPNSPIKSNAITVLLILIVQINVELSMTTIVCMFCCTSIGLDISHSLATSRITAVYVCVCHQQEGLTLLIGVILQKFHVKQLSTQKATFQIIVLLTLQIVQMNVDFFTGLTWLIGVILQKFHVKQLPIQKATCQIQSGMLLG